MRTPEPARGRPGRWLGVGVATSALAKAGSGGYQSAPNPNDPTTPTADAGLTLTREETHHGVAERREGTGIKGSYVRPGCDPKRPLCAPAGGFIVRKEFVQPSRDKPRKVWLLQEPLFKSTYESAVYPARG
jgi:hypothetical protein